MGTRWIPSGIYASEGAGGILVGMIGTLHAFVIDCEDIETAANFYEQLTGMARRPEQSDETWITLQNGHNGPKLSFQRVERLTPPQWPSGEHPQQMHLDVWVGDLDDGERQVLKLGAVKHGYEEDDFRVYIDPAGHPFCLVTG